MTTWEAFATTPDRRTQSLGTGRYGVCAEAAHQAAWAVFDKLPRKRQTVVESDALAKIQRLAEGGASTWWWLLAGTTFGVRRPAPNTD